jgi:bifunctional DNA-binding transcriptional regulator/antitoxin component of YhaV-PrlF toxin-antitoxin module
MRKPMALCRHGNSFHVTIPPPIREYMGWNAGEELMGFILEDKSLRIITLEQFVKEEHLRRRREELMNEKRVPA